MNLQVPLGVLPKRETQRSEMIDIMSSLQRYVPHLESALTLEAHNKSMLRLYINSCLEVISSLQHVRGGVRRPD